MIANDFPQHLIVGAQSGFTAGTKPITLAWQRIGMQMPLNAASVTMVDLGAAPMPTENKGKPNIQEMIEKSMVVKPKTWDLTLRVSYNLTKDDQTNTIYSKALAAGQNFQRHINNQVFKVLNAGDSQTYGPCYDDQDFFDSDHVDKGAHYQTAQDNEYNLALSPDNFNTVRVAASKIKDDQGENCGYNYNLLVVPPDLEVEAAQICRNPNKAATANNDINPFNGRIDYVVSPELDTTAWHLLAADEAVKPIIVGLREAPFMQAAWFEPLEGSEGGYYYIKFMGRYIVVYGDWRLAVQGNS